MRRLLATAWLSFALIAPAAVAGGWQAKPPLEQHGRWLTDARGRVAVLHGVNMVYKVEPYHAAASGFGRDDARFLRRHGFNTVRLGVIYKAVEPEPGEFDRGYLRRVRRTERVLARQRIFTQVDFHQDLYNERFQGEGFPDWAVQDDGLPAVPQAGFPANYFLMPALLRAFDNFWANAPGPGGMGLQDYYARAWRVVAARFANRRWVMGYDVFNEPWPGSPWLSCANPAGCPGFDTGPLLAMSAKAEAAIRRADPDGIVWFEPNPIYNNGADSSLPRIGSGPQGFSFHDYCLPSSVLAPYFPEDPLAGLECETFDGLVFDNADTQAEEAGQALLLSEFGATNDPAVLDQIPDLADEHMVSWQYWHYCDCDDPTTTGVGVQSIVPDAHLPPRGENLNRAKLDRLERPYPQLVAGTPLSFSYDDVSGVFELRYDKAGVGGRSFRRGRTRVFLPRGDFAGPYSVTVRGAAIMSRPGAKILKLQARGRRARVSLIVTP